MLVRTARLTEVFVFLGSLVVTFSATDRAFAEELQPFEWSLDDTTERGSRRGASVELAVGSRGRGTAHELLGGLSVSLPFDQGPANRANRVEAGEPSEIMSARKAKNGSASKAKPTELEELERRREQAPQSASAPRFVEESELAKLVRVSSVDFREACESAARVAGLDVREAKLIELAARARRSAALPDLRLRAARSSTGSVATVPTSYDPLRQTLSDGVTTWLEARATWHLDRAVFASEELRVERLELERRRERERMDARLGELLFGWQSAVFERLDPSVSFRECRAAFVRELQLAAELEYMTRGWFTRWRDRQPPLPSLDCASVAERVER